VLVNQAVIRSFVYIVANIVLKARGTKLRRARKRVRKLMSQYGSLRP
jgi:hypothetical protein